MIRWVEPEPDRLHPQEQALLSLCDRMTVLEQALTAEIEAHAQTRKELSRVQATAKEGLASLRGQFVRVSQQLATLKAERDT